MADETDKLQESPEAQAKHHYRMRHDWRNLIEDLIEEGYQQGVFDNLPGEGKPLNLRKNLFEAERELAHKLLRNNDLTPAWIVHRSRLLGAIQALRSEIQHTWARHGREFGLAQGEGHRGALAISWDDACRRWETQIVELNKQIDDFNLKRLIDNLEIYKLTLVEELRRAGAPRWLK